MCEVIKLNINKSISFKRLEEIDLTQLPSEQFNKLANSIYNETINTPKSFYRTEEENKEIANTDAKQFLTAMYLNKLDESEENATILPGDFYLVTSSTRTIKCAFKIGIRQNVTVNPTALLSIFEQVGLFTVTSKEIVNLFENPFLIEVVNHNWDSIRKLVDAGVDLKDKSIIRLNLDLNEAIHKHLTHDVNKEEIDTEDSQTSDKATVELDDYVTFAKIVKQKGYHFTPEIEVLMKRFKELEGNNKDKDEIIESLKTQAGVHLKKTKHYLNKIKKGK